MPADAPQSDYRQRLPQDSPFRVVKRNRLVSTENVRSGPARFEAGIRQPESMPCRKGRSDDKVVAIYRQQGSIAARQIGIDDPV